MIEVKRVAVELLPIVFKDEGLRLLEQWGSRIRCQDFEVRAGRV